MTAKEAADINQAKLNSLANEDKDDFDFKDSLSYLEAMSSSRKDLEEKQRVIDKMIELRKLFEELTMGSIIVNSGADDSLIFAVRQLQERQGQRELNLSNYTERASLLEVTGILHDAYIENQEDMNFETRALLKNRLKCQRDERLSSAKHLGNYDDIDAPSDVDAIASLLSIRLKQYIIDKELKRPKYHGDKSNPECPFALLFSCLPNGESSQYELVVFQKGVFV
jgi:hypothetical protein